MGHRPRHSSRARVVFRVLPTLALAIASIWTSASTAWADVAPPADTASSSAATGVVARATGSGSWYWPLGTESFGSMSGWLDVRGSSYHVAQDMPGSYGQPVRAIGAGTVWKALPDAAGYGPGGGPGGAVIIIHTTATGQTFRALYGHLQGLRYREGDRVAAGAVVATLNGSSPPHLHFGIHPGTYYPDGNPFRGHVPQSWSGYGGWVDPVAFLRSHPRVIPYAPPALPLWQIVTGAAPAGTGAAAGTAYWTEQSPGGAVGWAWELNTGARRQLDSGETAPAFDTARYLVDLLPDGAPGFTVRDRLPVLELAPLHSTPLWGTAVGLSGLLVNATGHPFGGGSVRLEARSDTTWHALAVGVTGSGGRVTLRWTPRARTALRLRFVPPASGPQPAYLGATSGFVTVAPHVRLTVPAPVASGLRVTLTGYLTPRHAQGAGAVRLEFQHFVRGVWVSGFSAAAVTQADGSRSRYVRTLVLPAAGGWRVRAVHPEDGAHARTLTPWRTIAGTPG